VTIDLISWGSRSYDQPIVSKTVKFEVPALGSKVVKTMPLHHYLTNESLTLMDAVVQLRATAKGNSRGENPLNTTSDTPLGCPCL
jgi:hypothetical protein